MPSRLTVKFVMLDSSLRFPSFMPSCWGYLVVKPGLTLIGMREVTFHPLSFLDQILSAEYLSEISKLFWRWKLTPIRLIWHPAKLIEPYKTRSKVALKMSIFLAFIAHARVKPLFLIRFLAPLSRLWLRLALSLCMLQKCVAALGCSAYYVVCRLPFRSMNK